MRLKAFRIRNFRSIVDTGWRDLSPDKITVLIGQNESGKTSILEALHSFHTGDITETDIRSDLSDPSVSCSFETTPSELKAILGDRNLPTPVKKALTEVEWRLNLTRSWDSIERTSKLVLEEKRILDGFSLAKAECDKSRTKLMEELHKYIERWNDLTQQIALTEKELQSLDSITSVGNETNPPKRSEQQSSSIRQKKIIQRKIQTLKEKKEKLADSYKAAEQVQSGIETLEKAKLSLDKARQEVAKVRSELHQSQNNQSQDQVKANLKPVRGLVAEAESAVEIADKELRLRLVIASKVLDGKPFNEVNQAERSVEQEFKGPVNEQELADIAARHTPVIELFKDDTSLLPNQIDVEDVLANNENAPGLIGVQNFLIVAGLEPTFYTNLNLRICEQKILDTSERMTKEFATFWQQTVGKKNKIEIQFEIKNHPDSDAAKAGKEYFVFWVMDGGERLYPAQRSKGVRWFLSFYLQLRATARRIGSASSVLLVDEPGHSLHARAQEDVLKVFEDIVKNIEVIYTAHSPYLISLETVYRILAVQRTDRAEGTTPTEVLSAHELGSASLDTLTPLYSLMGARITEQQTIKAKDNVILEELSAFYYIKAFVSLTGLANKKSFLPCNGVNNVPIWANLFLGWGLEFSVLIDDDSSGRKVYKGLKNSLFIDEDEANKHLLKVDGKGIEDIFSSADFAKLVLQEENVDLSQGNSIYMKGKSKALTALQFMLRTNRDDITFKNFDKITQENIKGLMQSIESLA